MHEQRRRAGNDDEPTNNIGKKRAYYYVRSRCSQLFYVGSFFDHRRLHVELHPGGDGGADDGDGHINVTGFVPYRMRRQFDGGEHSGMPGRSGQKAGEDVGQIESGGDEKDFFHAFVIAFDDQQPDQRGADGHGDIFTDMEQLQAAGDAGKLRHDVAEVHDDQQDHHDEGDAQTKLFADEIA